MSSMDPSLWVGELQQGEGRDHVSIEDVVSSAQEVGDEQDTVHALSLSIRAVVSE